jgi:hypothetical protein
LGYDSGVIQTPVALLVFNRPDCTAEMFASVRAQRPPRLLIIADGPRPTHPSDVERCAEVRAIVEQVDWPCEVSRNYAESNLGLKRRVGSGLDWVFGQVERAIVLEDDCVAHPDFFMFCDELLERYADDDRVWVVTGNNFQGGRRRGHAAYYFSKYNHCWGWATWRRAWTHYQSDIPFWKEWRTSRLWRNAAGSRVEREFWDEIFDKVERNEIDSWAYPWTACVWYHGGLTATPNVNLVTNIGFGSDATHTAGGGNRFQVAAQPLGPLRHPGRVAQNRRADQFVFEHNFGEPRRTLYRRGRAFSLRVVRKASRTLRGTR